MAVENLNICKFNFNCSSDLLCKNFVYETSAVQASPQRARLNGIHLVVEGTGTFVCGERRYDISSGTLFFVPEGERFSIVSQEDLKYFYIQFHGRRGEEYMLRLGICASSCVFTGCENLIPFWKDCSASANEGNIDFLCEAVLLYSLSKLRPDRRKVSSLVGSMVALTQKLFSEPDLSIGVLAQELGYSDKYLSSVFKKQMGIPYTLYLQNIRMKHAVFLMEEGVVSVKNVALLSGFRDPLYFSRLFSKTEGISPKQYIQRLAECNKDEPQLSV